jgi:hypothetical protein
MKNLVVIGVNTYGVRETKEVTVKSSAEVISAPSTFGFSKVSAVMTAQAFKGVTENGQLYRPSTRHDVNGPPRR